MNREQLVTPPTRPSPAYKRLGDGQSTGRERGARTAKPRVCLALLALLCLSAPTFAQTVSTRIVDPKAHAVPVSMGYPYRQHCEAILRLLDLRLGDVAVDIGTGDGWWAEKLASAVGEAGTVYAAEIDQKIVDKLKDKFAKLPPIKPHLCKPDDPDLPDGSCDLAFFSQVYHHLPDKDRVAYLEKLRRIVKPTGRVCVIEKYSQIAVQGKDHGTQLSRLAAEAEQAGWIAVRYELIPATGHYIAIFAQKEVFAPLAPPKPAEPSSNGKPREESKPLPLQLQ